MNFVNKKPKFRKKFEFSPGSPPKYGGSCYDWSNKGEGKIPSFYATRGNSDVEKVKNNL